MEHFTLKNIIGVIVVLAVISLGIWGYEMKSSDVTGPPAPEITDLSSGATGITPAIETPELNPFKDTETNPFDAGYTNPFE